MTVKILLIEDDDSIHFVISRILSKSGDYELKWVQDPFLAVSTALDYQPHLILCDVMMPGMNGFKVLEVIRKEQELKTISFIFLTSMSDKKHMRKGMIGGADDYLTKPFTPDELIEAIEARLHRSEEQLDQLKLHDQFSDLPNLLSFNRYIEQQSASGPELSVIFCFKLERFSYMSDVIGLQSSQQVLRDLLKELQNHLSPKVKLFRAEGFRFVVINPECTNKSQAIEFAEQLLHLIQVPVMFDNRKISVRSSIGISYYPEHGTEPDRLLQCAMMAVHHAQELGGSQYSFYQKEIEDLNKQALVLEQHFFDSLNSQQFFLVYQPKMNLRTNKIEEVETLIRWKHPEWGVIPPNRFIPLAEKNGFILDLGQWILNKACQQISRWQSIQLDIKKVAVNISVHQLEQSNFIDQVMKAVETYHIQPQFLEFEVTESIFINNIDMIIDKLDSLKKMGITISVDDFGTGYSTFSYLQKLPADKLKIDQSFIRNVVDNENDQAITKTIIEMAHQLHLTVIAEGVETIEQLEWLKTVNCDEVQGYYLSKPISPAELQSLISS